MEIKLLTGEELESHLTEFCELFRSCFNDSINEEVVRKRYLKNKNGLYMAIAEENGKYVSCYAVIPTKAQINGQIFKTGISMNLMTNPKYEGRKLFTSCARLVYEKLKEDNFDFVYCFPNYLSHGLLCAKLGWQDVAEIPTLECDITDKPFCFNRDNFEQEEMLKSITVRGKACISKDWEYLNMRYFCHSKNKYYTVLTKAGGCGVYKYYQNIVNIVELHSVSEADLKDVIGYIAEQGLKNNCDKLTVWAGLGTQEHLQLEKLGFRNKYPITYFTVKKINPDTDYGLDLADYRNWKVCMGDDNVY